MKQNQIDAVDVILLVDCLQLLYVVSLLVDVLGIISLNFVSQG